VLAASAHQASTARRVARCRPVAEASVCAGPQAASAFVCSVGHARGLPTGTSDTVARNHRALLDKARMQMPSTVPVPGRVRATPRPRATRRERGAMSRRRTFVFGLASINRRRSRLSVRGWYPEASAMVKVVSICRCRWTASLQDPATVASSRSASAGVSTSVTGLSAATRHMKTQCANPEVPTGGVWPRCFSRPRDLKTEALVIAVLIQGYGSAFPRSNRQPGSRSSMACQGSPRGSCPGPANSWTA